MWARYLPFVAFVLLGGVLAAGMSAVSGRMDEQAPRSYADNVGIESEHPRERIQPALSDWYDKSGEDDGPPIDAPQNGWPEQ